MSPNSGWESSGFGEKRRLFASTSAPSLNPKDGHVAFRLGVPHNLHSSASNALSGSGAGIGHRFLKDSELELSWQRNVMDLGAGNKVEALDVPHGSN